MGTLSVHKEVLPSSFLPLGTVWGQGEEEEVVVCVPQPWSGAVRAEMPAPESGSHHIWAGGKSGECTPATITDMRPCPKVSSDPCMGPEGSAKRYKLVRTSDLAHMPKHSHEEISNQPG